MQLPIQLYDRLDRRLHLVQHRIKDLCSDLAEVFCLLQNTGMISNLRAAEASRLARAQNSGLLRKPHKVFIRRDQLLGSGFAKTPVERVNKIEHRVAGNEFEGFRHFFSG